MSENLKPGDTQVIFALSVINGQPNYQEQLPVQPWNWPKGTYLDRQRDETYKRRHQELREREAKGNG